MFKKSLLFFIKIYQKTLSLDHGFLKYRHPYGFCRFRPTCSEYAHDAISQYGAVRGLILSARRLLRCHPWSRGGWDPIEKSNIKYQNSKIQFKN